MDSFKIRKNSWHYRFILFCNSLIFSDDLETKNFCQYWRVFVYSCIKFSFRAGGLLALFGAVLLFLYAYFQGLYELWFGAGYYSDLAFVPVILHLTLALFLTAVLCSLIKERHIREKSIFKQKPYRLKKREPSLFATKYRSWKQKVCPPVEYVNE